MHVYYCAECASVEYKVVSPAKQGCAKAPFHRWINLGLEGGIRYRCSMCKKEVNTLKKPVSYGCKEDIFHCWEEGVVV